VGSMPTQGTCPGCDKSLTWLEALSGGGNIGWKRQQPKKRHARAFPQAVSVSPLAPCKP